MTPLYLATGGRFGRVDDADAEVTWTLEGSGARTLAERIYRSRDRGETSERLPAHADAILALTALDGGG